MQFLIFFFILLIPWSFCVPQGTDSIPNAKHFELKSFQLEKRTILLDPINEIQKQIDPLETELNYPLLAGIGSGLLGISYGVQVYQKNAWWKDQRTKFHFYNDWEYALWIDKTGHLYGTYMAAHIFSAGLEGANVQAEAKAWCSSALALSFQLFVEVQDGFGPQWGFSPGDAYADVLGAAFPVFQYYYPYLHNFDIKFSYFPADLYKKDPESGQTHIVMDDYAGQKYWLALKLKNMLPEKISHYWPEFLCLALGVGVRELDGSGHGKRDVYLALDLDAETIPLYGKYWEFVKSSLNYIHFPMPGIRFTPKSISFVLAY